MQVEVFHNVSRDASFGWNTIFENSTGDPRGYVKRPARTLAERHPMVKVFAYTASDEQEDQDALAYAFEQFNVGEDGEAIAYRSRRLRSLSVGDVICVVRDGQRRYYSCDSFGWGDVDPTQMKVLEGAEAVTEIRSRFEFRPAEQLSVTVPLEA